MPFDSLTLAAVTAQLQKKILGTRVIKVHQPNKTTIILRLHGNGDNYKLLLCAHPQQARVHLVETTEENPAQPPLFCMVLRKHLEGGRLVKISQNSWERILLLDFEITDETGMPGTRRLVVEIMGKHSNIILLDQASEVIFDGIRRYSHNLSRHREVLPGRTYLPPPLLKQPTPENINEEETWQKLLAGANFVTPLAKAISQQISGISPFLAKEIVARAGLGEETTLEYLGLLEYSRLYAAFKQIKTAYQEEEYQPVVLATGCELYDYYALPLVSVSLAEQQFFPDISQALEYYHQKKEAQNLLEARKRELNKINQAELSRVWKKIALQEENLAEAEAADKYKEAGELLTTYIYLLKKGMDSIDLESLYEPGKMVNVELNPQLAPSDNIKQYFHRYNKAKNSRQLIESQIAAGKEELAYLESVALAIENADDLALLAEIRQELADTGYLQQKPQPKGSKKTPAILSPHEYVSSDGYTILAGRNNRQNDYLTLNLARKDDIWLHTQKIPGSHVIIRLERGQEASTTALVEAAAIAAWHSQARLSSQVPVDFTLVRQVKKPAGAKPGMVIYQQQKTLYVTPGLPPEQ